MLEGFKPISVDTFGSLTTVIDRADVAVGLSPANQNVRFTIGGVYSRPGLITFCVSSSYGRFCSFDDFVLQDFTRGRIIITDKGYLLWQTDEDSLGGGVVSVIESGLEIGGITMKCVKAGKRTYMAFSNGTYGVSPPRQYDGTYLDTIGTEGPVAYPVWYEAGTAPSNWTVGLHRMVIVFETRNGLLTIPSDGEDAQFQVSAGTYDSLGATPAFQSWPIGPPGTIRRRMYVTPAYTAPVPWSGEQVCGVDYYTHPDLWLNDNTTVDWNGPGVSDSTLMSEYVGDISSTKLLKIRPLPMVSGLATYSKRLIAWGALNEIPRLYPGSGIGEWATPGSLHFDGGTISAFPNRPYGWTYENSGGYAGETLVDSSTIPGGTGQILKITGDGSTATRGALHTTHSVKRIITLAPGEASFGVRLRIKKSSDFDGVLNIWVDGVGTQGYQECGLSGKTGGTATGLATTHDYYFKVNIDGTGIVEKHITTASDVTYTAVMALMNAQMGGAGTWALASGDLRLTSTSYSAVSTVSLSAGTTGDDLFAALTGFTSFDTAVPGTGGVAIDHANIATSWSLWTSNGLFPASLSESTSSGYVHVSVTGVPANNSWVAVDRIDIFPDSQPYLPARLFVSELDDYETFVSGDDGELSVNEGDGEAIRCCYELRGILRVAKEHSLWSVTDNGDVPGNWPVELASGSVGTLSLFGAAIGDGWAVIADQGGLFLDTGGIPEKISHEIQPDWDAIDWNNGHLIRVSVDLQNKLIFVLVPTTLYATYCTKLFVLDYVEGFGDPIAGQGHGRKWTKWTIPGDGTSIVKHIAYVLRGNGQKAVLLSGGMTATQGFLVKPDPSTSPKKYDNFVSTSASDAVGFDAYYDTANIGGPTGRTLFGYATITGTGAGTLKSTLIDLDGGTTVLPDRTLSSTEKNEIEIPFMKTTTKLALRMQTNPSGATTTGAFSVSRASLWAKRAPFSALRGY